MDGDDNGARFCTFQLAMPEIYDTKVAIFNAFGHWRIEV